MITGRDGENSQTIKTQTRGQCYPAYSRPERQQAAGMQENELADGEVIQPFVARYGGDRSSRVEHLFILTLSCSRLTVSRMFTQTVSTATSAGTTTRALRCRK